MSVPSLRLKGYSHEDLLAESENSFKCLCWRQRCTGSFDCVVVRFANDNSAQDDKFWRGIIGTTKSLSFPVNIAV